jgi:hypothetical protein
MTLRGEPVNLRSNTKPDFKRRVTRTRGSFGNFDIGEPFDILSEDIGGPKENGSTLYY